MKAVRSVLMTVLLMLTGGLVFVVNVAAASDVNRVVVSIKPIQSLVAAVMKGVGEPHLIVKGNASPHTYVMKPSDARALESARVVFWVGPELERFLEKPIVTLAGEAKIVSLVEVGGLEKLKFREGGPFEDHGEEEHEAHDAHEEHEEHEEHEAGETDMHIWLDPANAKVMVSAIAEALSETDDGNASKYRDNAAVLTRKLDALIAELGRELTAVRDRPFIVFHDGYQYFEKRFGLKAAGSITVNPDVMPGARRVSEMRDKVSRLGATCVFAEPQFESKLVRVVTQGTSANAGTLDPMGAALQDGPELYFELMRAMTRAIRNCLSKPG